MDDIRVDDLISYERLDIALNNLVDETATNDVLKNLAIKLYKDYEDILSSLKFYQVGFYGLEHLYGYLKLFSDDMDLIDSCVDDCDMYTVQLFRVHFDLPEGRKERLNGVRYIFLFDYTEKFKLLAKMEE